MESPFIGCRAFTQKAIEAFRVIQGTKGRIAELHKMLLEYQRHSVSEMASFSSSVDISDMVKAAIDYVKGMSLADALMRLAMLGNPPGLTHLREQAEENKKRFVLQSLFPRVYLNAMGKVIARQPRDADESLQADMYNNALTFRLLHVRGLVEPAMEQINSEYYVRVNDFLSLLTHHPFVPQGREMIVARGLPFFRLWRC